jgi:hypothetical protein
VAAPPGSGSTPAHTKDFTIMNVVAEMLLTEPAPAAIWALLMLLSLPAMLLLASPEAVRDPRRFLLDSWSVVRRHRAQRAGQQREAEHAVRFADELTVAAERAGQSATRWYEHWQQAEQGAETAWQAWQEAEQTAARSRAAAAFAMPAARTPAEYADRERFLHRAVGDAVGRDDLPAAAMAGALAGRGGWDARLHPVEQQLVLDRAVAAHRYHRYRQAVTAEQTAWHDTQLAHSTRDSLRREATVAVAEAAAVRHLVPAPRPTTEAARRLVFARTA